MGPETSTPSTSAISAPPSAQKTSSTALAPGFRFHPTDEELVIYYLKRKMCGKSFRFDVIADVDIYKTEPWDLAGKSKLKTRDQEWYFFSALDRKYANGARMNRATSSGYWKATGNDRNVQHESRVVGLKKTLVFHSGRAPEGKRTNWVMHEYRLVEEELEKCGNYKDAYVLCRIFHKANLGPPTGHRYAPFVEEEWDGKDNVVPSVETREEAVPQQNGMLQEMPSHVPPVCRNELPTKTQCLLAVCKSETMGETIDDPSAICPTNRETAPLLHYKRRRDIDLNSIDSTGSENSPKKTEGPSSSTITTARSAMNLTCGLSTLVEYSLMESLEIKEKPHLPLSTFAPANLNTTAPPECLDFIHSLQEEIYKVSIERETLRLEMLSIRSMANVLQSKVEHLTKENEELKRKVQDA
ncbi:hypothetical protein ACJRO7_028782 [Eucalyptus globulus]|uniref:NAC domain-containing protein n=1 Tax=Eucalyptus globulus TaxID=34317 RepID=A0ABD3JVQ0_EUCGL